MSARPVAGVEELLASSSARGRALYRLVRELLDELDESAPWSLLNAPPAGAGELESRLERLLEALERVPGRVAAELAPLAAEDLAIVALCRRHARWVEIAPLAAPVCRDPGEAEAIVTGDADLLTLGRWRGIDILSPRQLLERGVAGG